MHRSETEQYGQCASCGAEVSTAERVYAFGDDEVLCFECAVARRGAYDELHDHWRVAPNLDDLLRQKPSV